MRKLFFLVLIVLLGAAMLVPVFLYLDLEPQQFDFLVEWQERRIRIPATYSLCASLGIGLFYWFLKK
jgi:hypothetical protein